jgi:hypothetical protein
VRAGYHGPQLSKASSSRPSPETVLRLARDDLPQVRP